MFGFFTPVCPVSLSDKIWVEQRLPWIFERFGTQRILAAPRILPTGEFFPEPYQGPDDVPALFSRVCHYMGTDAQKFQLGVFTEKDRDDAHGLYHREGERPNVLILESLLPDREAVIATMAHEVAHDLLLGTGLMTGEESDHEALTDLLPVVLGMGTFQANTAIKMESGQIGNWSYWQIRRSGYLTASVCGYAMGVIEYLRDTQATPSVTYLGLDAAGAMRGGLRYLRKTRDCLIDPTHPERPITRPTTTPMDPGIQGSASRCLFVLREWLEEGPPSAAQIDAARHCLRRKESVIQGAAIDLLATAQQPSESLIMEILNRLESRDISVRIRAIVAIATLRLTADQMTPDGESIIRSLIRLASEAHVETAVAAGATLGTFGPDAKDAVPALLNVLALSITTLSPSINSMIQSLKQIVGDPIAFLRENPETISAGKQELIEEYLPHHQ
jgi:hypothetical protein